MSNSLVEFRSPSRNLQIWIPTSITDGFSVKFIDGVILVTEEQAGHMRKSRKNGTSFVEVKRGAVLPPKPPSLDPVIRRHPSDEVTPPVLAPVLSPEQEFKESFGASTQEFEPPAQHIHLETADEKAVRELQEESVATSASPAAPAARQPIRKAPALKENIDVTTHQGS